MRVCGFGIARDAVRFGYPLEASLRSLLPIVDEIVLNVGRSDDGTWGWVRGLNEPRIKAFQAEWDPASRHGGRLLADQTNRALERCTGDWALYLQADEVLHEQDYPAILRAMQVHLSTGVEALTFRYHHFYGSFQAVQDHPFRWYRRAIRAVKLNVGATSRGDAMDFGVRRAGRMESLRQTSSGAWIYHYGWARPPDIMVEKQKHFHRVYHEDEWITREYARKTALTIYSDLGHLRPFRGTHPSVMQPIVVAHNWPVELRLESQPPEWLRHSCVSVFRHLRSVWPRAWHACGKVGRAFRSVSGRFIAPNTP